MISSLLNTLIANALAAGLIAAAGLGERALLLGWRNTSRLVTPWIVGLLVVTSRFGTTYEGDHGMMAGPPALWVIVYLRENLLGPLLIAGLAVCIDAVIVAAAARQKERRGEVAR